MQTEVEYKRLRINAPFISLINNKKVNDVMYPVGKLLRVHFFDVLMATATERFWMRRKHVEKLHNVIIVRPGRID